MKIFIGSDHGGFDLKSEIITKLGSIYDFCNCGTNSKDSCDYPDIAKLTIDSFLKSEIITKLGILICKSGIGMSIMANRNSLIRGALCSSIQLAKLAREHNNANFLCLGADFIEDDICEIINTFIKTKFSNEPRHCNRVAKLTMI